MRYIRNTHIAPITCNARNRKGAILFTKRFQPERIDGTTGRVITTGYMGITDEEYEKLCEGSRTFVHYKDDLGLLTVCDELPPEAMTPQEALVGVRRKEREAQERAATLEAENLNLKAALSDAERKYKDLFDASKGGKASVETLKELEAVKETLTKTAAEKDKAIYAFKEQKEAFEAALAETAKERDALKAAAEKAGKDGKGREFD
jgi:hypothetical protein